MSWRTDSHPMRSAGAEESRSPAIDPVLVNIGAGRTRIPGFVNVDLARQADVSLDLSEDPLPFDDSSVDLVFSYHTLEHVPNYLFALGEIHRVLKHGAPFLLGVPYVSLTYAHQVNPYHLHNFNEVSFDFFEPVRRGSAVAQESNSIAFEKVFHRFHYIAPFGLLPPPIRGWARRHLLNTVRKIDYGLIAVKQTTPVHADARALKEEFDRLLESRVPYGSPTRGNLPRRPPAARRYAARIYRWSRGGS